MDLDRPGQAPSGLTPSLYAARRAVTLAFAAQGAAVGSLSTTVPAVTQRLGFTPSVTTAVLVGIALLAGVGSFAGLSAIRRVGSVATMRGAVLAVAAGLLLVGWAPGQVIALGGYALFALAVGAVDVSASTRAAAVERGYGRSIFASFYAAWSAAGAAAALLTALTARLGWSITGTLTLEAVLVVGLAAAIRSHPIQRAQDHPSVAAEPVARDVWTRLVPFGLVLLVVYVVDSTISSWSAVYLNRTLSASLAAAPLAYAAYQIGTVVGRACADRAVRRAGPVVVVRAALLLTAISMVSLAAAPSWALAVLAAGCSGLGTSALAPLCQASAARLRPSVAESILARLNLFNYAGVLVGGAVSGVLGSSGLFRLAYAAPAILALALLTTARHFSRPVDGAHHSLPGDNVAQRTARTNTPRSAREQETNA